jgi:hypothetical protein
VVGRLLSCLQLLQLAARLRSLQPSRPRAPLPQYHSGRHYGLLYPLDEVQASWDADERLGGTYVELEFNEWKYFSNATPEEQARLCIFARTGGDGSYAAFWLDDDGNQKIVHLGSGSGSTLLCVLTDDAVDFLRLLAIGYEEICWPDEFDVPPNTRLNQQRIRPNHAYRTWVETMFSVDIPKTGREIVRHPALIDDSDSPDPFWRWAQTFSSR